MPPPFMLTRQRRSSRRFSTAATLTTLTMLTTACAGRATSADTNRIGSGGAVLGFDAGGVDAPPGGARSLHFGASMRAPHHCVAPPGVAPRYVAPKLRCATIDMASSRAALPGAVVPSGTDETAVRAAIAAAGDTGIVAFQGGTTYTLCGSVSPRQGQRWTRVGTGAAILRRCDARATTLTAATTLGAGVLHVPTGAGFPVGAELTVVVAAETGDRQQPTSGCPLRHRVTAATATTRTITPPLSRAFAVGDKVISAFPLIDVRVPAVRIDGLLLDGNSTGNPDYSASETFQAIDADSAPGLVVADNTLRDGPADLLALDHCQDCRVEGNVFEDAVGSALHLSRTTGLLLRDNRVQRIHGAAGGVRWGGGNTSPWLHRNCVADVNHVAWGTLTSGDRGVRIARNALLRVGGVLRVTSAQQQAVNPDRSDADDTLLDLTVSDNYGVDVGTLRVGGSNAAATPAPITASTARLIGLTIRGNLWLGGRAEITAVRGVSVRHNTWVSDEMTDGSANGKNGATSGRAATPAAAASDGLGVALLTLRGVIDVDIDNNILIGGRRAVRLEQRAVGGSATVRLTNNMLLHSTEIGLSVGDASHMNATPPTAGPQLTGFTVSDNTLISALPLHGSTAWAALIGHGAQVLGNCVEAPNGVRLESQTPAVAAAGAGAVSTVLPTVVFRNNIRPTGDSIGALGAGGGLFVRSNWLTGPIAPVILGSKVSTVSGNFGTSVVCAACWPATTTWLQLPADVPVEEAL